MLSLIFLSLTFSFFSIRCIDIFKQAVMFGNPLEDLSILWCFFRLDSITKWPWILLLRCLRREHLTLLSLKFWAWSCQFILRVLLLTWLRRLLIYFLFKFCGSIFWTKIFKMLLVCSVRNRLHLNRFRWRKRRKQACLLIISIWSKNIGDKRNRRRNNLLNFLRLTSDWLSLRASTNLIFTWVFDFICDISHYRLNWKFINTKR